MSQTFTLSVRLPLVGTRSWNLAAPSSAALSDIGQLAGGSVKATVSAKESADGILFGATAALPWGPEALLRDFAVGGLEREAIDKFLAMDGGEFDCSVTLSENL